LFEPSFIFLSLAPSYSVDTDGFTTYTDPFRYKYFAYTTQSPDEAAEFCQDQNALLPVCFPSNVSRRSLVAFMSPMSSISAIYLGISLERLFGNGTMLFRTQRGLYQVLHSQSIFPRVCMDD
jgi:hypothetical protein